MSNKKSEWTSDITAIDGTKEATAYTFCNSKEEEVEQAKQFLKGEKAAKSALTRKIAKHNKELVEEAIGKDLAAAVVDRIQCLISDLDYAIDVPSNRINRKDNPWKTKLSRPKIYNHLAGHEKLYYTTKPYQIDGMNLVMVTIDIDNPKHVNNSSSGAALKASKKIQRDLKKLGVSVVCQPSTNGNGYHLTFCISFPENARHNTIRNLLSELRSGIANKYQSYKCHEICLKGINFSARMTNGTVSGTLVKLPSISSQDEAMAFLSMTEAPVSFSSLSGFYSLSVEDQDQEEEKSNQNSSHSSQANNTDSVLSKTPTPTDVEGTATVTKLYSWEDKTAFLSEKLGNSKHEWKENDPLGRMFKAASDYCNTKKKLPTVQEILEHYQSLNLHTGAAKPDRKQRAEKAVAWVTANHNFTIPSEQTLYRKWEKELRAKKYSKADLTYSGTRAIKTEHLALVVSIIERKELEKCKKGLTREYFITISRDKKKRGEIGFTLDDKKVAFCFKLLIKDQVIEEVEPYRRGKGGIYRLFKPTPPTKGP